MELRHLRYFVAVVEERHFGRAAERLHIVQPALSMQIRNLEEEIGTPLLARTSRRFDVTDVGKMFYEEAVRTLTQANRALTVGQRAARGEIGAIRIGYTSNAVFGGVVTNALREFRHSYPDVTVQLIETSPFAQAVELLEDRIDVGFALPFHQVLPEGLARIPLGSWPWMIGMSCNHQLTIDLSVGSAQLRKQEFVICAEPFADEGIASVLRRLLGCEANIVFRTPSWITALTMAAAGYGITLLPSSLKTVSIGEIAYRPIRDFPEMSALNLVVRATEQRPVVQAFTSLAGGIFERSAEPRD